MMRPIHNVVSGVKGLLWTPKVLGRLPLFGGTVATRKWSPFRSPAFGRVSTIAGHVLTVAIILLFIALPALFAGV